MDLAFDVLFLRGRIESLAVDFELAGIEIRHEAWRAGDRLRGTTRRFDRKERREAPLPDLADLGSPLAWLRPELPEGRLRMWSVRPPDLRATQIEASVGPTGSPRRFEAGGARISAVWSEGARWPMTVEVKRKQWADLSLKRVRNDELPDGRPFAPRLQGRCPLRP